MNGKKSYILLFTSATTRAVHLELTTDCSTWMSLLAFPSFISRRGIPETMYSDNGLTFKRAAKDLQEIWERINENEFRACLMQKRIVWKFIIEGAL